MPLRSQDEIVYFTFGSLEGELTHAIFTRRGGVSPAPWASLNLGGTVGDDPARVRQNRLRALLTLGLEPASVYDVWQVHGVEVAIAEAPRPPDVPHLQADVLLTDKPGVTLMMRFADCVPILLYDPVHRAAGMAHAGWLGTVSGTVRAAVQAMQQRYGSQPADLRAAIGPSIGPDHYEIGPDVIARVRSAFGEAASDLLAARDGRVYFDLWSANRKHLEAAGVTEIETAGLCTACHTDDWFSHRAEKGRTGRFGAVVTIT